MAKKALGIEIKEFLRDGIPQGFELDNFKGDYTKSELENFDDNKFYDLRDKNFPLLGKNGMFKTFSQAFSTWKRKRDVSYLLVEVPKDKIGEAEVKITELGYKVRK